MQRKLFTLGVVFCILFLSAPRGIEPVEAETSSQFPQISPPFQIWDDAGQNDNPAVVYNPLHDEYLVVWATTQDQFSTDIWGRRLRGDGTPIPNGWFNIDNYAGMHLLSPTVAYNSHTDQYLVVYSAEFSMDDLDIWGKIVNWNGSLSSRLYFDARLQRQMDPAVVYNHLENQYLVAYSDWQTSSTVNLMLKTLNQNGVVIDSTSIVSAADQYRGNPSLAYSALDNRYLVVYGYEGSFLPRIYGKSFSSKLGSLSPEFHYNDDGSGGQNPNIACSTHECLVTWSVIMGSGVRARRIAPDGTPLGPNGGFEIAAPIKDIIQASPAISIFNPWGYLITWSNFLSTSADESDIYGSVVGFGDNNPMGTYFPVDERAYFESTPDLACDFYGRCLLALSHNPVQYPAGDKEISGRLISTILNYIPLNMK